MAADNKSTFDIISEEIDITPVKRYPSDYYIHLDKKYIYTMEDYLAKKNPTPFPEEKEKDISFSIADYANGKTPPNQKKE